MHRRAILAIACKDALDAIINRSTMLMLLSPILVALIFAIFTQIFSDRATKLLIYNPSGSAIEQVVISAFSSPQIERASSSDDVAVTFGADGMRKSSDYTVGLVVPADFETLLRAGDHPTVQLYVNGDTVGIQQRQLLMQALEAYSHTVASPTPPAQISVLTINPPTQSTVPDLGKFYAMAGLLTSFMVGTSLTSALLVEEKEKKTLRMLMVSSASWGDIVAGKLLVGMGYQLLLSAVVLAVTRGFVGQVLLVLVFALLGSLLTLALGLLLGSILKTTTAASATSVVSVFLILPTLFVGPFGHLLGSNAFGQVARLLPTYYLAEGVINALQESSTIAQATMDILVVLGVAVALFIAAVQTLRRQFSVTGTL